MNQPSAIIYESGGIWTIKQVCKTVSDVEKMDRDRDGKGGLMPSYPTGELP